MMQNWALKVVAIAFLDDFRPYRVGLRKILCSGFDEKSAKKKPKK